MKHEKCLTCKQLGNTCDGPNFMAMETEELGLWCNRIRKQIPGMTYDKIAAVTGVSKSSVHGFLNGTHADFRLDTIRPVVKYITGGKWEDESCGNVMAEERTAYENRIQSLEAEISWRDDRIQHLLKENGKLHGEITDNNENHKDSFAHLQKETKRKNRIITALTIIVAILLAVIIAALVVDYLNTHIGFFWLESLLHPQGDRFMKSIRGAL